MQETFSIRRRRRGMPPAPADHGGYEEMLFTIALILLILWLLGFATHVVGSAIHVVLVIALVLFVVGLFTGRRTTI
jgi:hypothetical protein